MSTLTRKLMSCLHIIVQYVIIFLAVYFKHSEQGCVIQQNLNRQIYARQFSINNHTTNVLVEIVARQSHKF